MDVITLEGDEINRKGGMSGGYHDEKSARLLVVERIRTLRRDLRQSTKERKDMEFKVPCRCNIVVALADRDHAK